MYHVYHMETLAEYLKAEKIAQSAFAKIIEVDQSTVSKWISGENTPRPKQIRRIAEVTGNRVSPSVWFGALQVSSSAK